MTTLISYKTSGGKRRSCNARCYNAKHPQCVCICGGMNHSKGLQQASENTRRQAEELVRENEGVRLQPSLPLR